MLLSQLLFLLMVGGIGYAFYVVARILFGLRGAPTGNVQSRSTANQSTFAPGFRRIHLYIFLAFDLAYSLVIFQCISPGDWSAWDSHPYWGILLTFSGPFSTAIFQPRAEHWKAAWGLFPYCAAFLLLGVFCQLVRLPSQRHPRRVAIVMWVTGLLGWFNGGLLALIMAA
jgi:hypothetical protein